MKIYLHGATGDVTGSADHVKTKHASVLIDCGLFQGGKEAVDVKAAQARFDFSGSGGLPRTPRVCSAQRYWRSKSDGHE